MQVFEHPETMTQWSLAQRDAGISIAFVPTMGALHRGHIALIERAHELCDLVVVSIFVNKLQFNVAEDFAKYPRPIEADLKQCEAAGVAAVYAPTHEAMYPVGFDTKVTPGILGEPMEGASRPGHFEGMATVVVKLFNAVMPHTAVFGEKDYQQLAIVRAMVRDLNMPLTVDGLATVREDDGLALSSRNVRLSASDRTAARAIPQALEAARNLFASGVRDAKRIEDTVTTALAAVANCSIDYVQIADATNLSEVTHIERDVVLAIAVWFGDVRLIDNTVLRVHR